MQAGIKRIQAEEQDYRDSRIQTGIIRVQAYRRDNRNSRIHE
jgi:hypothetical protein